MQTYEILVQNRAVKANSQDMTLVRTSIGIDQVHVLFDDAEWLGFPVSITFAQGEDVVTQTLALTELDNSEWVAEATVVVPHEVIDMNGPIRVTLQGTDARGRHIITAAGSPLSVEEAGDVLLGPAPEDAPTADQWQQAYSNAVEAGNAARSLVENLNARIESIVSDAKAEIDSIVESLIVPATKESLGIVKVGDRLTITEDGTLSAVDQSITQETVGLTVDQANALLNLRILASYAFETEFTDDGLLMDTVKVKPSAIDIPIADIETLGTMKPDGTTVTVDDDGMLHASFFSHDWDGTVLTTHGIDGDHSVDLLGPPIDIVEATGEVDQTVGDPQVTVTVGGSGVNRTMHFAFSGIKGEQGIQGPSGYVLTEEDIELISDSIYERYLSGDETRY